MHDTPAIWLDAITVNSPLADAHTTALSKGDIPIIWTLAAQTGRGWSRS